MDEVNDPERQVSSSSTALVSALLLACFPCCFSMHDARREKGSRSLITGCKADATAALGQRLPRYMSHEGLKGLQGLDLRADMSKRWHLIG